MSWRNRFSRNYALLAGAFILLAGACGDNGSLTLNQPGDGAHTQRPGEPEESGFVTPDDAREYIEREHAVVMPWTREVGPQLIELATVQEDALIFPAAAAEGIVDQYESGDVLVSADFDKAFLRKVVSVERVGEDFVVHTTPATLGQAIYKGSLSTEEFDSETRTHLLEQSEYQTRFQELAPSRESFGSGTVGAGNVKQKAPDSNPIKFSIDPSLKVKPSFYLDVKIVPGSLNRSHNHFYSPNQRCPGGNANFCAPYVNGSDGGRTYRSFCGTYNGEANVCQFEQTGFVASCDSVIASLDFAEKNPGCNALFKKFYRGELGADAYNRSNWEGTACEYRGGALDLFMKKQWYPPHPVHVDWAKANCEGSVKRFVVDGQISVNASTGRIGVEAKRAWKPAPYTVWQSKDVKLAQKVFFIGWLPVLITSNASLRVDAQVDATLKGSLTFDALSVSGLTFGGGFNRYERSYEDNKGVYVDGRFQRYSKNNYGVWQLNPWRLPNPTLKGLTLSDQSVLLSLEGKMHAKLSLIPRVDLLLYDIAGPFLEPFTIAGEVQLNAGGSVSSMDGVGPGGNTCNNSVANLCARVGAEGNIGISARRLNSDWDWTYPHPLYTTCSDYCPANREPLCAKWCYPDGQGNPIKIVLQWTSDNLDLDLKMSAPDSVNYQRDSATQQGWKHLGDTCPTGFPGCTDRRSEGFFKEIIVLEEGFPAPDNSTNYRIDVKTNDLKGAGGTYDLLVYEGPTRKKTYANQTALPKGQTKTFSFTMR